MPDTTAGWRRYLEYLASLATDELAKKELVAERMSRGWCVGDRSFKTEMKKAAAQVGADLERYAGLEPEAARVERVAQWEERLEALAKAAGIDLANLPAQKSHPHKALLAAAMKSGSSPPRRTDGWPQDWTWDNPLPRASSPADGCSGQNKEMRSQRSCRESRACCPNRRKFERRGSKSI